LSAGEKLGGGGAESGGVFCVLGTVIEKKEIKVWDGWRRGFWRSKFLALFLN